MNCPLLYNDRPEEEQNFIKEVCNYILDKTIYIQESSNDFAGIFVEGRNREINTLEDWAAIWSFNKFSLKNYPVFCFVNNKNNFLNNDLEYIKHNRINIIEIPPINSLEEYSKFCIEKLYYLLPAEIENVLTIQPDGMLLKSGWEDWITDNNFDLIGAHWRHTTGLSCKDGLGELSWVFKYPPIYGCNLGFSFRKASKMREISETFKRYPLRQWADNNCPEDVFFSYFGFGTKICKLPTLKECDIWCKDPLTLDIWNDKENLPFGHHFIKTKSEFPKCDHG